MRNVFILMFGLLTGLSAQEVEEELAVTSEVIEAAGDGDSEGLTEAILKEADSVAIEVEVQVEESQVIEGVEINSEEIEVTSPWPAKPIIPAPEGWAFYPGPELLTRHQASVELSNGETLDLSIAPFVIKPDDSQGSKGILITEPGYSSALKGGQINTIGALLNTTTVELESKEKQVANVISNLQQLLATLPKN